MGLIFFFFSTGRISFLVSVQLLHFHIHLCVLFRKGWSKTYHGLLFSSIFVDCMQKMEEMQVPIIYSHRYFFDSSTRLLQILTHTLTNKLSHTRSPTLTNTLIDFCSNIVHLPVFHLSYPLTDD